MNTSLTTHLTDIYEDLHRHPELSFHESRTAGIVAEWLREHGFEVTEGVGGTGVVGVLRRGDGPVVWVRADMDALPLTEATGLPYSSTADGVAHACGHDVHVTSLLGAAAELAAADDWSGTVVAIFQPAEEIAKGARAMVDAGIVDRFPKPVVVLGQHVAPLPAGVVGMTPGPMWAATDSMTITVHGRGGHGSRPETTIDPVVIASSIVLRLQTIVSREIATTETAVVTIGALHAGTKHNIIADTATMMLNFRTYDPKVRDRVLASITRIVNAECEAAGSPLQPEIVLDESSPTLVNDIEGAARTKQALEASGALVIDPGPLPSSEDIQILSTAAGVPVVFWLLGGADPALFPAGSTLEQIVEVVGTIPSNHSPKYAPVEHPTLENGVRALVSATRAWLQSAS